MAAVHVARVRWLVSDWAPKAWRALQSSAAASLMVLTGFDGMFFPPMGKDHHPVSPNILTLYEIVFLATAPMFSWFRMMVKMVLRLLQRAGMRTCIVPALNSKEHEKLAKL